MVEKEIIDRQFKMEALNPPDFNDRGPRVPEYDFSASIFSKDPFQPPAPEKVST